MTTSDLTSVSGLVLDIIGVAILFRTGLPNNAIRETGYVQAYDDDMARKYDRWAAFSLFLILGGFILQIVGIFLPYRESFAAWLSR